MSWCRNFVGLLYIGSYLDCEMIYLVVGLIVVVLILYASEGFQMFGGGSTSPGTLLQLVAKGPQDVYLTGYPTGGYGRYPGPYTQYGYPSRYYYGRRSPYLGYGYVDPYWIGPLIADPGFGYPIFGYGLPRHYPRYRHHMYPF